MPQNRHAAAAGSPVDLLPLAETVKRALSVAASRTPAGGVLTTSRVIAALAEVDGSGRWERIFLLGGHSETWGNQPDPASPERRGLSGRWDGVAMSTALVAALNLLPTMAKSYAMNPVPVGALALVLVADATCGAAAALMATGLSHQALIDMVQDDLLNTRLDGLHRVLEGQPGRGTSPASRVDRDDAPTTIRPMSQALPVFLLMCAQCYWCWRVLNVPFPSPVIMAAFALMGVIVSIKPRAFVVYGLPLLDIPLGATPAAAFLAVGVLTVGQLIATIPVAVVASLVELWREDDMSVASNRTAFNAVAAWVWKISAIVSLSVISVIDSGLWSTALLVIPMALFWFRHYVAAIAVAVIVVAVTSMDVAPVVLIGLSLLAIVLRRLARPLRQRVDLPKPSVGRLPLVWLRCTACDSRIRGGDLIGARRRVHAKASNRGQVYIQMRLVYLDLEEGNYQSGLDPIPLPRNPDRQLSRYTDLLYARALGATAQYGPALTVLDNMLGDLALPAKIRTAVQLLQAETYLSAGMLDQANAMAEFVYGQFRLGDVFERLRACRVLTETALYRNDIAAAERWYDAAGEVLFEHRRMRQLAMEDSQSRLIRETFGNRCSVFAPLAWLHYIIRQIRQVADRDRQQWDSDVYQLAMSLASSWDELVDLLLADATAQLDSDEYGRAATSGSRALMELDRTRYQLAAQSARTSWSRRFARALAITLDAAHGDGDHLLIAELLEFARTQTLPVATAESMLDDLTLSTPPVVHIRGQARLARPGDPHRPPPVSIESAARRTAGSGAWWLSYWETTDWIYWSAIPPNTEAIETGRIWIGPNSELRQGLDLLQQSLPVQLQDEDAAAQDFRLNASPLFTDPAAEFTLATQLGRLLLPKALTTAALAFNATTANPLPVAIAPSPSLGYLPWGLLALDTPHGPGVDLRLLDVCNVVLAPSVALLVRIQPALPSHAPLAVAVVDTMANGDLTPLPWAWHQAEALPTSTVVLGGHHQDTYKPATLANLEHALQREENYSAIFMCHAIRGTPDRPSDGGLVLAADDDQTAPALLNPGAILRLAARGLRIPTQVLLQACDTSALADTSSGEWLTIAPAFLAAGCREVVATVFPIIDHYDPDDPIISAAVAGTSLRTAVWTHQRACLARWRSRQASELAHTPLAWAAYAVMGFPANADHRHPEQIDPPKTTISKELVRALRGPSRSRAGAASTIDSGTLLADYIELNDLAEIFGGSNDKLTLKTLLWVFGLRLAVKSPIIRDRDFRVITIDGSAKYRIPRVVCDAFCDAYRAAAIDGTPMRLEHALAALLDRPSAARRSLRLISRIGGRHFELTVRAIAHNLADEVVKPRQDTPFWQERSDMQHETLDEELLQLLQSIFRPSVNAGAVKLVQ